MLEVRDLHVRYGESHVLQGVSLQVPAGGVTALLGRNGAGKSTTIKAILGLVPRQGHVELEGRDISRLSTHEVVRRGVAYVPEDREVFGELTVAENLRLAERDPQPDYGLVHDLFPELRSRAGQRAGTLSGGQQQMVALGRALLNRSSRLLLVDEPTKGLAPAVVSSVVGVLERAAESATMLLVEQNVAVARRLARRAVVLDQGRVAFAGPIDDLLADPTLARRYLGVHG